MLNENFLADTESRDTVTDTYLRNLESSRMRHVVLPHNFANLNNDEVCPLGGCKRDIEDLKSNSDENHDDDDDVIILK